VGVPLRLNQVRRRALLGEVEILAQALKALQDYADDVFIVVEAISERDRDGTPPEQAITEIAHEGVQRLRFLATSLTLNATTARLCITEHLCLNPRLYDDVFCHDLEHRLRAVFSAISLEQRNLWGLQRRFEEVLRIKDGFFAGELGQ